MADEKELTHKEGLEEEAKAFILEAYKTYKDRHGLEEKWAKWDKLYNNITTEQFYKGAANLFPPETRRACKTLINFADEVLFSQATPFKLKGVGGDSDNKKAEIHTIVMDWQHKKIYLRRKIRKLLESLIKYGFVWIKAPWALKEKYVLASLAERDKLKKKINGEDVEGIKKSLKTMFDNIDFQVKDPRTMYWNYYKPWDEQDAIIERNMVNWNHLRILEKAGIYYGIDRLKDVKGKKDKSESESVTGDWSHIMEITGLSAGYKIGKDSFELLESWCNFDLDKDGLEEESVITLANQEHIIRLDPNPFDEQEKPFFWVCWDAIEGTSLGMGVPQLAEKDQIALNDFTNQIMDNITQILNCMKIVDELAEISDTQLKSRPNGIIRSKAGVDAVKFERPPNTSQEGLKAVAMSKENIRQGSGATVSLQGLPARYDTTATEYTRQGNASARDVFAKLREIEDYVLIPFYRRNYAYNLQFLEREKFIKIVGRPAAEEFLGTDTNKKRSLRDALTADLDIIALGVTQMENKVVKGQQLINFLNISLGAPPGIVDLPKLYSKIWKYVGDNDDIILPQPKDTLISPADENLLMQQGIEVHAKLMENHPFHMIEHQKLQLPEELQQLNFRHIMEHQQLMQILQQARTGAPPQEQPRGGPERITEESVAKVPGAPAEEIV